VRGDQSSTDRDVRPHDAAQRGRQQRKDGHLDEHACGHDPGVARLSSRKVVADQDVRDGKETDRHRERCEHLPAGGELWAEASDDQADTGRGIEEREPAAKDDGGDERASEDVVRLLAPRLTCRGAREEDREDRRGEEEPDPREGGRCRVRTSVLRGKACLDDEQVDVRQERNPDEADCDGPQVADERPQVRVAPGAGWRNSRMRKSASAIPAIELSTVASTAPPRR
jgi:hypothetical protein